MTIGCQHLIQFINGVKKKEGNNEANLLHTIDVLKVIGL